MNSRRALIVVTAAILAAAAGVATYGYLEGVEERAFRGATLVEVFRVKARIAQGEVGETIRSADFVEGARIPREFRPASALTSLDELSGKRALTELSVNTVLTSDQFGGRDAPVTFANTLGQGLQAISISVDPVRAVAGLLVPGDHVNVHAIEGAGSRIILEKARILAIGTATVGQAAGGARPAAQSGSGLITLEVGPLAAARMARAAATGSGFYLTLVPSGYTPTEGDAATPLK
ncbi:MAG: Flp pilus assembly protein CpaB [Acidimicrobiales bacterium]